MLLLRKLRVLDFYLLNIFFIIIINNIIKKNNKNI